MYPENLKYSKSHEWVRVEGDKVVVGITSFATGKLGDIVFVELPEVGSRVAVAGNAGTVESVKAVSDLYSPVSGVVAEINANLEDSPETVNESPYEDGWLFSVKIDGGLENLMDSSAYELHCDNEE
jgi:glycine cleavage system H protein